MIAGTVAAALVCYTVSLRVSTERSGVEKLQRQVVADMRDVRALEAELSTRARKPVLQRWNDNVLGLGAPLPKQFASDAYELAAYAPGSATSPTLQGAPDVQQAVARDDGPIAPVQTQRSGLQTAAYVVPERGFAEPVATEPKAVPEKVDPPKPAPAKVAAPKPVAVAAKRADPLAGLLDDIDTSANRSGFKKVSMR